MTKNDYLKKLKQALKPLKRAEINKYIAYFSELIDDRMEEGISEGDAVAELESISAASERILSEAKEQGQLKKKLNALTIVLIVLGFPIWFPLLLTVAIVISVMYLMIWILIGVLFITSTALVLSGVAGLICLFSFITTNIVTGITFLGIGLVCAGIGISLFIPAMYFARAFVKATPVMWNKLINIKMEGGVFYEEK